MASGGDSSLRAAGASVSLEIMADCREMGLSSPAAANRMMAALIQLTGVADPYADFKRREMRAARTILERLEPRLPFDDLRWLLNLSALGNSLDFFNDPEDALADLERTLRMGPGFHFDDTGKLSAFLETRPGLIVFLTDNAGEAYFDLPLYRYLAERAGRVLLTVKGAPSLNDLTRADLETDGLDKRFDHIADTGIPGVGLDWEMLGTDFKKLLDSADLILAKGMANFETIYPVRTKAPVFFLFKVKCRPIEEFIKAPINSCLALWRDGEPG